MKQLRLILLLAFAAFSLNLFAENTVEKNSMDNIETKSYSIEWQGSPFPPSTLSGSILIIDEYTEDNKLIQRQFTDTINAGFKTELLAKEETAYVIVCFYDRKTMIPMAYPLVKLIGKHTEIVITELMMPGLRGNQKLNKKGDVVTTNKKLAPCTIEELMTNSNNH